MEGILPLSQVEVVHMEKMLSDLYKTSFFLNDEDSKFIGRLIKYANIKTGLSKTDICILQEGGMMNMKEELIIPSCFLFRGVVMPSFWCKALLMKRGIIKFDKELPSESI